MCLSFSRTPGKSGRGLPPLEEVALVPPAALPVALEGGAAEEDEVLGAGVDDDDPPVTVEMVDGTASDDADASALSVAEAADVSLRSGFRRLRRPWSASFRISSLALAFAARPSSVTCK